MKNTCIYSEKSGKKEDELFENSIGGTQGSGSADFSSAQRYYAETVVNGRRTLADVTEEILKLQLIIKQYERRFNDDNDELLTTGEAAKFFKVHQQHLRNLKSQGKLGEGKHYIRVGRKLLFRKNALLQHFGLQV
ncbi:helix-turn-helix domain-containing protein [Flexistipes sp.]|uniref:helix-turn-helix domain-containing protein n=1 Tax=Flexistipes sp. TaxID=3088135 RepID=UPI002E1D986D|nr:helix-turn-helix domain-containing protein [Flexistipes sp.]